MLGEYAVVIARRLQKDCRSRSRVEVESRVIEGVGDCSGGEKVRGTCALVGALKHVGGCLGACDISPGVLLETGGVL